jgi:hypothetical protein
MSSRLSFGGDWETHRAWKLFRLIGRRKPGVTMAQVEADLNMIAGSLARQYPLTNADTKVQVVSQQDGKAPYASNVLNIAVDGDPPVTVITRR